MENIGASPAVAGRAPDGADAHGTSVFFRLHPLLHFLLLGGLLFVAAGLWPETPAAIVLPAGATQAQVDEEILLHEALAQGLDTQDSVARERLLLNMRFAFPQAEAEAEADDARLLREARRLGMHRRDRVVRLRLVERMRQQLRGVARLNEAELTDYLVRHAERLRAPTRYRLTQKFFSSDRPDAAGRATAALARLQAAEPVIADAFLLGEQTSALTQAEIAQRYGASFAAAVVQAPAGLWSGPHASAFGLHLVQVETLKPAAEITDAIRAQAAYAALAEKEQRAVAEGMAALRRHYRVKRS